jgi:hypothetical protein
MTVKKPEEDQPKIGDIHAKNVSVNQSGGITGDIHFGAPKRTLARNGLGALEQTLRKLGTPTVGVTAVMGDAEAYDFATQIMEFVQGIGWALDPAGVSQAIFSKPIKGVDIAVPASRPEDVDVAVMVFGKWLADNHLGPVAVGLNSLERNVAAAIRVGSIN